jgi:hypothetical protein
MTLKEAAVLEIYLGQVLRSLTHARIYLPPKGHKNLRTHLDDAEYTLHATLQQLPRPKRKPRG